MNPPTPRSVQEDIDMIFDDNDDMDFPEFLKLIT